MEKTFNERFLENRDESGRQIYYSHRTGVIYPVEPITTDKRPEDWGSEDPATKQIMHKKGYGKHTGAIFEEESLITNEQGFKDEHIHRTGVGESVQSLIEKLDAKYPDKAVTDANKD